MGTNIDRSFVCKVLYIFIWVENWAHFIFVVDRYYLLTNLTEITFLALLKSTSVATISKVNSFICKKVQNVSAFFESRGFT